MPPLRRSLESSFARFRRSGDLRALARVFDGTARDLLQLAQHLTRDLDAAEDLLQSTFVTAIDRAASWDERRPLRPWLAGILAHHAANSRRARARNATQESTAGIEDESAERHGPPALAIARELNDELARALARLGEPHRSVLERHLLQGQRPEEIARELGRAPGTVRSQLSRALERLRRILPAGVGAGLALALGRAGRPLPRPLGLAGLRAAVLRHAGRAGAGTTSTLAASTATIGTLALGGIFMGKTLAVSLGAAAVVTTLGVIGLGGGGTQPPAPLPEPRVELPLDAAQLELRAPSLPGATPAVRVAARDEAQPAADGTATAPRGRALVRGRIHGLLPEHAEGIDVALRAAERPTQRILTDSGELLVFAHFQTDFYEQRSGPSTLPHGELVVEPDGSFTLDLTEAVAGEEPQLDLELEAVHEVYTCDSVRVEFDALAPDRVRAGEEVVASAELELVPAAVLRGRVRKTDAEEAPAVPIEGLIDGEVIELSPYVLERSPSIGSSTLVLDKTRALFLTGELSVTNSFVLRVRGRPGIDVGLLRDGEDAPIAVVSVEGDGSFELKVPVEGAFHLVALTADRPPLDVPVELELYRVTELEEELEIHPGPTLEGFVEDLGAFPEGGITLVAERADDPDERRIDWEDQDLVWSHGLPVRRSVEATTEQENRFRFEGLSEGYHHLRFRGAGEAHALGEGDAGSLEVPVPANGVQLVLPIAVLELSVALPADFVEDGCEVSLAVMDPTSGAELARTTIDARLDAPHAIVAPPGRSLRLVAEREGLRISTWEGTTPEAGRRTPIELCATWTEDAER